MKNLIELHVPDFDQALSFYTLLGFQVVREEPCYRVIKSGANILNLYGGSHVIAQHSHFGKFPTHTPRGFGVEIVLFFNEIDALFLRLQAKAQVASPPKLRAWGVNDFRVVDPFGFYLRISEPYDPISLATTSDKMTDK